MHTSTFIISHILLTSEDSISRNIRDLKPYGFRDYYAGSASEEREVKQKIDEVPSDAREIFEKYSSIESDRVLNHVVQIRDRAYEVFPYDTIGQLHFLNFYFARHPQYQHIIDSLRGSSRKLLDLGCCFGQMIRKMVYDGAPAASIYGIDIEAAFISLGYELFLDEGKLQSHFIVGDFTDMDLRDIKGTMDVVVASAFFHLFSRPKQLVIVHALISVLRPQAGSMAVGAHLGSTNPAEYELSPGGRKSFRHSPDSFAQLWEEAAASSESQWKVDCSIDTIGMIGNEHMGWAEPNMRRLVYTVTRK